MNKPMREGFVLNDEPIGGDDDNVVDAATELEATAPPAPVETWPITVRLLHKQIRNNKGEMQSELHFREPTAGDISRAGGNPCRVDSDLNILIDDKRMMTLMANLCGILEPFLATMDPRDYNSCAYRLRNFFLPEAAAWM